MSKKELLNLLKTSKKTFGYIKLGLHDGLYIEIVKSDFIKTIQKMDENTFFENIVQTDDIIYIN